MKPTSWPTVPVRALRHWGGSLGRRWSRDEAGTSMVTTAFTLPLFIVILMGIWWVFLFMYVRWMTRQAVNEAALYISDQARYWNINPNVTGVDLLPEDWYDYEAKRLIWNRLIDILPYHHDLITQTLIVTVTEPLAATGAVDKPLCDIRARDPGTYRPYEEYGFMVLADFEVPFWRVRIPYMDPFAFKVRYRDRAVGYVQCPRWTGQGTEDLSKRIGAQGPDLPYRRPTPGSTPPTVTPIPPPTATLDPNPTPTP